MTTPEQDRENAFELGRYQERQLICAWLTDMVAREHFSDEERRMVTAIVQNIERDVHRRHASTDPGSPWCEPCRSFHPAPKSEEHHRALKCFAPWPART